MSLETLSLEIAKGCMVVLGFGSVLCAVRLFLGPKLADRVVAIDLFGVLVIGMIILYTHISGEMVYLDVAIVLALIAFLGTVIFARFLENAPLSAGKQSGGKE